MSEVKLDANGLVAPSISLGNNILSSEDNKLLWNGEEFKSGGGHNVGEQWVSMDGTIPFGGLAFLGQTVSKETYIELYNWVETNNRFKTEAEWQALYTANNGNVSFYAYDGHAGKKAHADFSDDYYAHLYEGTYFYSYFIEEEEYIFDKDVTLESIKEYANHISENSNFDVEIIYLENETYAFNFIAKEVGTQFNDISITHINVAGVILGEGARVEMYTTGGKDEVLSDTFRLPSFKGYLKANEIAGGYTKEGLPNITGNFHATDNIAVNADTARIFTLSNGAFYQTGQSSGPRVVVGSTGVKTFNDGRDMQFAASRSSSIYGNSEHVTPETNTILIGVYAFNTIINPSNLDIDSLRLNYVTKVDGEISTKLTVTNGRDAIFRKNGARLYLCSLDDTEIPGDFILRCPKNKDCTDYVDLRGNKDGNLTWGGKPIICLVESGKSGTTWYKKYSDGFIEQGGIHTISSQGAWDLPTITFLKPFSNTDYSISVSGISYSGSYHGIGCLQSKTTTSFKHYFYNNVNINPSWYACGY